MLGGEALRFNVLPAPVSLPELGGRNLSFWDGTGTVVWSAVPDTEELSILSGPLGNPDEEIIVDGSTMDVPGFVIGGTSGSGSLHEHIKFLLLPDGLAAPPVGPDDGVYLVLVELGYDPYAEMDSHVAHVQSVRGWPVGSRRRRGRRRRLGTSCGALRR